MTLEEIILSKIPPAVLERVVFDQGVLDVQQRVELFKASGLSSKEIAERVVATYGAQKARLALGLYDQISDYETAKLLAGHLPTPENFAPNNHQASLVGRIPTLPLAELGDFLSSVKSQICLIVSRNGAAPASVGTGFLIGPNLVLTCRHVFRGFPDPCDVPADGRRVELYFDFHEGKPVEGLGAALPRARKVALGAKWHVASSSDTHPDGLLPGHLTPEEVARISQALDFVLLKLDEPIGLQPVDRGGGRRRGWVSLPPDNLPLVAEDWIIIPQHPQGFPQRIDLGRFREPDQTNTRLRYNTNTAKGTSGAPCFNHRFHLVGLHNAYVGPEENPLANQAIRFDLIMARIKERVAESIQRAKGDSYMFRWSIARLQESPRVILGRQKFLEWLRGSVNVAPPTLATRVYAAHAKKANAGCTYSVEILDAETRDGKAPRAVYGGKGQQLPATAGDFLISLLRELGIDHAQRDADGNAMPPRPDARINDGTEVDKLDRWLSDTLPNWLDKVITGHVERQIDLRDVAQDVVKSYESRGAEPPAEEVQQAKATQPVLVRAQNAWDYAYVVVDDLRAGEYQGSAGRLDLKVEVYSLIAALVKGKSEALMGPGLKRLRWVFLGYLPDFIAADPGDGNGATAEVLDPDKFGVAEVKAVFDRISKTHLDGDLVWARTMSRYVAEKKADPTKARLVQLQEETNELARIFVEEAGKVGTQP